MRNAHLRLRCVLAVIPFAIARPAAAQPADGEDCHNCIPVSDGNYIGTTADNTGFADVSSCTHGDVIDEWYCYTAPATGLATAGLCGSSYDTAIAVFAACDGAELACNDDFCGPIGLPARQSGVTWGATSGHTYYIRISGYLDMTGNYFLYLHCTPIGQGPGYECWNARTAYNGNTFGITDESPPGPDDTSCTPGDIYDLWYVYEASCHGRLRADTCLNGFDTSLGLFSANCDGLELFCNDDGCDYPNEGSRVTWLTRPGEIYLLRVSGYNEGQGPFVLRITCEPCESAVRADLNGDASANGDDVAPFVAAAMALSSSFQDVCAADFDDDGIISAGDAPGFVTALID